MVVERFEDILAWQKAKDLTVAIHSQFKNSRDYAFRNQIQRASVSIMNNIAEGFERKSNKELTYFLFVAKGSCCEVRSMFHLAAGLDYLTEQQSVMLAGVSIEVSKMLSGFIKKL